MSLFQDAAYSHRFLTSRPGFTVAAALTLALGIGANTAVFSVFRSVLIRPLPLAEPDRAVIVHEINLKRRVTSRGRAATFGAGGEPVTVRAVQTDAAFFDVTGYVPVVGRGFHPDETRAGA